MSAITEELYNRQGGLCFWCARKLNKIGSDDEQPLAPTLDHLAVKAIRGKPARDNLVVACRNCNAIRGSFNIQHWEKVRLDNKDLKEEKERLTKLLTKYLEQPWWRKIYIQFFRFVDFLREQKV